MQYRCLIQVHLFTELPACSLPGSTVYCCWGLFLDHRSVTRRTVHGIMWHIHIQLSQRPTPPALLGIMWHIHFQSSQKPTLPALLFTVRACPVVPPKTTLTMILHKMLHQTTLEKGCLLFCLAQECWLWHTAAFYLHVLCITCLRSYRPETRQLEIPMTLMG